MRKKWTACLLAALLVCGSTTLLLAQESEPVIHRVPPRPADTLIMLPDGSTVHVELAKTEAERAFGLMERSSLPQGRGMLFIHDHPGEYGYWMYNCKIGLDIVWMDADRRIVELSPRTPPCKGKASSCPSYGGHATSLYVLELPVGSIKAHNLQVGQTVNFNLD
ncbi:MAG TPA: DUF192 domain-containing protein [Pseudacidobacterium sp.]|jgi:hypothetical protein|nr:DUF192 domain-containing protein [Pseudacidobacterium sp.]